MFEKIKSKKENILKIYTIILIVATIIFSRNTMITTCIIGFNWAFFISIGIYIPMFIMYGLKIIRKEINLKKIIPIIIMIGFILLSVIIKGDWQLYNISIVYYIIATIILQTLLVDFKCFKKYYINIMLVLAVASLLVTYVAKPFVFSHNLVSQLEESNLVVENSVNNKFLNLGLGFALLIENYNRNFGIFTEPNFYQFYLIMAIALVLLSKDKKKVSDWIKTIILVLTACTTQSTTGIIMLIGVGLVTLLSYILENRKNVKKVVLILATGIITTMILVAIPAIRENLVLAYEKITTTNDSSQSRFGSIRYTVDKFIKSPIIGNEISEILWYEDDLTNTTFTIAAIYGVVPFLYLIYCNWKLAKQFEKGKIITVCILGLTMLAYNSHMFLGVQSFWMILLLGFSNLEEVTYENTLDS